MAYTAQVSINRIGEAADASDRALRIQLVYCAITLGATADYGANGFAYPVPSAFTGFGGTVGGAQGANACLSFIPLGIVTTADAMRPHLLVADPANLTIRAYTTVAGVLTEITPAADLAIGDRLFGIAVLNQVS